MKKRVLFNGGTMSAILRKSLFWGVSLILMCGCAEECSRSPHVILLKHEVNDLDSISYHIRRGYIGVEFDLHMSDNELLVYYDDRQKACSFVEYVDSIRKYSHNLFWIDVKKIY